MKYQEMITLLKQAETAEEIDAHREEIAQIIPACRRMFDYDQQNEYHQYDLWMHCLHTVTGLPGNPEDDMLYLAALLHDIGKPDCRQPGHQEGDTNAHYYGHPKRSAEIVQDEVLPGLYERGVELLFSDQKRLWYYVRYHDDRVSLRLKSVRRHLERATFEEFQNLMLLEVADARAHVMAPVIEKREQDCLKLAGEYGRELYREI